MKLLRVLLIWGLIFLGWGNVSADQRYTKEDLLEFARFLYKNKEYARASYEFLRVFHLFENSPSEKLQLNLKIGRCFSFLNQTDQAAQYFRDCLSENPPGEIYNRAFVEMGFLMLRNGQYRKSLSFLEEKTTSHNTLANTLILANMLCQGDAIKAEELLKQYKKNGISYVRSFDKYLDILSDLKLKSPLKAAIMSAVLPGSGRIYAGRVKEGILSMVSFFATSYLAYEGFHEEGVKSFKGWLFSSIGAFLYVGNIYGSVLSARLTNRQLSQGFNRGIELSLQLLINE